MQLGDALADLREFLEDFVDGKLRQAVQLQFEDGVNLDVAEAEPFAGADAPVMPYFLASSFTPFIVVSRLPTRTRTDLFSKNSCKFSRALARLDDPRMILITSSMLSSAMR